MANQYPFPKKYRLQNAFWNALEPPPDLTIDEWADKYRILASEASSEPGPWRTDRFPYLREIMKELSPQSTTEEIVFMKGAQVGATELCLNHMGYNIHWNPCPMLYVQKTVLAVERFSKQRFQKSLENTPEIRERLLPLKSRDGSATMTLKNFPGGVLILGGANSAASLRSMPIKDVLFDEEDSYEADIQEEGDPIQLGIRRTSNFANRKIFHISTPGIKETSKIEPLFEEGDQRYYYVPCPFCEYFQVIRWQNIIYKITEMGPSYKIERVFLRCENCEKEIEEYHKTGMLEKGEWRAKNPGVDIVSFHLNSLYSPLGFYSWKDAVKLWMKYKRSRSVEYLKVFINTVLGETFSESDKFVDFSMLASHKHKYPEEVPKDVKLLVAGVDVQDDRIECEVLGVGHELETWSIDYQRFIGDIELDFVWNQLDKYLMKPWRHENGIDMYVLGVGMDSGYKAKVVYDFCKKREFRRILPVKGRDGWGRGLIERPNRKTKEGVWLHHVWVDEMKAKVFSMLKIDQPGPGYCHFPDKPNYDDNYFQMLTAERLQRKRVSGQFKLNWVLYRNRRNEALDCRNYALGILYILYPNIDLVNQIEEPMSPQNIKKVSRPRRRVISKGIE